MFTLKVPKTFSSYTISSYLTNSCREFFEPINSPEAASESGISIKDGTNFEVCHFDQSLTDAAPSKINTGQDEYRVQNSKPFSINGYTGFRAQVKSIYTIQEHAQDIVILKNPFGGYATVKKVDDKGKKYMTKY